MKTLFGLLLVASLIGSFILGCSSPFIEIRMEQNNRMASSMKGDKGLVSEEDADRVGVSMDYDRKQNDTDSGVTMKAETGYSSTKTNVENEVK